MEVFKIEKLTFSYENSNSNAIFNINLSINSGDFVVICGDSGCGKTTLLRLLKPSIMPKGNLLGTVKFYNDNLYSIDNLNEAKKIGFVMQNPDNQIVCDKVYHELSFGLENLGIHQTEIRKKVSETASYFGISDWFHKKTCELSGGQKQILNLASIMVTNPDVIILDEPTSQLDPISCEKFISMLNKIHKELGVTIILCEHRLNNIIELSNKLVIIQNNTISHNINTNDILNYCNEQSIINRLPTNYKITGYIHPKNNKFDFSIASCKELIETYITENEIVPRKIEDNIENKNENAIKISNLSFRYNKNDNDVLKNINLNVKKGEIFSIIGANSSGKTTLLLNICGLLKSNYGSIKIFDKNINKIDNPYSDLIGFVPQNPKTLFSKEKVILELQNITDDNDKIKKISNICEINYILDSHPYDLSGGEMQKVSLACTLLKNPKILILDEPTKGLDSNFKNTFKIILEKLKELGTTIIMVTHDIEFCCDVSTKVAMMFLGEIITVDKVHNFFSNNNFYTTTSSKITRNVLDNVVTFDDILYSLDIDKKCDDKINIDFKNDNNYRKNTEKPLVKETKKLSKANIIELFTSFLLIPLTLFFGNKYLGDRKYYLLSLIIILEMFIPFIISFEKRRIKIREIVLISTLCALIVASRCLFYVLPQFKPMCALIIISGICLGCETGFIVGSLSAFLSNFFFGQGPWTPYQMLAFGLIGLISGILFNFFNLSKNNWILAIYSFFVTMIIYGGIMNPASVLIYQDFPNIKMIISSFIVGFPFDIIHSLSTAIFMIILSKEMIKKINRLQIKYF